MKSKRFAGLLALLLALFLPATAFAEIGRAHV